jgi:hypothetical protein
MSKSNARKNNNQMHNVFGPFGPSQSNKTTMGVDASRISNSRPSIALPVFPLTNLTGLISEQGKYIGRHFLAGAVSPDALPVNALVNVPNKDIGYVVTNKHANCIASQTTVSEKTLNGRKRIEVCIPYYDGAALETIATANPSLAAIAPLGSMKVAVDIHAGGILTGTDSAAMLKMDKLLVATLEDIVNTIKTRQEGSQPLLSAAGYGILPAIV